MQTFNLCGEEEQSICITRTFETEGERKHNVSTSESGACINMPSATSIATPKEEKERLAPVKLVTC